MRAIYALNEVDIYHLQEVMQSAKEIGFVTINVFDSGDSYIALNGSHRLEAAAALQLPVILECMNEDDVMEHDIDGLAVHLYNELDLDELTTTASVAQILGFINSCGNVYTDEEVFGGVKIV